MILGDFGNDLTHFFTHVRAKLKCYFNRIYNKLQLPSTFEKSVAFNRYFNGLFDVILEDYQQRTTA